MDIKKKFQNYKYFIVKIDVFKKNCHGTTYNPKLRGFFSPILIFHHGGTVLDRVFNFKF